MLTGIQTIDSTGKYVNELSGSITINNVNDLLTKAVQTNIFANEHIMRKAAGDRF